MPLAPTALQRLNAWVDARPRRSLQRLLFACVVLFVWSLDTHGNHAGTGDEPHYAMIAHSLVFDGDLDLANDYADPANLVGSGTLPPEAHAVPGVDGRLRPVHDIGLPLLAAPFFAVSYWVADRSSAWVPADVMRRARLNPPLVLRHLLSLGMIAVAAAIAVLLFDVLRTIVRSQAQAFFWTLVFVLSPPLLSHSFLFFTEIPAALLVVIVFRDLTNATPRTPARALALGLLVSLLLLLHVRNVGLVCGFALWWLWLTWNKPDRLRLALAFFTPLAAIAAIRTAINYRFWGALMSGPHAHLGSVSTISEMAAEIGIRTFGLLLDQEHGLLTYAPVYLLALPGLAIAWMTNRRLGGAVLLLVAASCLPILLPMINPYGWAGGWSPAARFLVPIAPLLAIAAVVYRSSLATAPRTVKAIVAVQWLLNVVYWSTPKVLWNDGTGRSALAALASPLDLPAWLPSWHTPSGYSTVVSVAVVAVWIVLSTRASRRALHRRRAAFTS